MNRHKEVLRSIGQANLDHARINTLLQSERRGRPGRKVRNSINRIAEFRKDQSKKVAELLKDPEAIYANWGTQDEDVVSRLRKIQRQYSGNLS